MASGNGTPVAAIVDAGRVKEVTAYLVQQTKQPPVGLRRLTPGQIATFDESLRSASQPVLEEISSARRKELENLLYGNAYRGITDIVTKFVWPRPARALVHVCANMGLTPNMVTTFGLFLVLATCWLFLQGHYVSGLLAGWLMTLLDTVDGKLARVTIQSSPFGHIYDHVIDLLHPPFWYIFWGISLDPPPALFGMDFNTLCWLLTGAYVLGRMVEGVFLLLGDCSIFTWRPFDAWFRLVTARRNPCLIILTLSVLLTRPEWGFISVVAWSVLSTVLLIVRLAQGTGVRVFHGRLVSWLDDAGAALGPHARSFRVFGGTRGAYGK
jgi:phosphatidylglycerophosphate synthase